MGWRLKSAQFKFLSLLPGGEALYRYTQENITRATEATRPRVDQKLNVGLDFWAWLQQQNRTEQLTGGSLLDLGAGWKPVIPLLWYAFGNNRQTLVDVSPNMDARKVGDTIRVFRETTSDAQWPGRAALKRLPEMLPPTVGPGASPALAPLTLQMVGLAPLQARFSQSLVPTLTESFVLTAAVIFLTFLVVFRSGPARIMTMIPSLFAILAMFAFMRLTGIPLNVATILIASTVLGTSENDQIHFFYHFLEKRKDGSVEQALRHTLTVSGRAILFATLINAGGFLAFVSSDLPPIRQFGLLSAIALVMSMIADFSALPAALWIIFRAKPDEAPEK